MRHPLGRRELALIFAFWTFLAILSSVNRLLDPRGFGFRMSPTAPVAMAFVETWMWAAFTPLIFWLGSADRLPRPLWLRILLFLLVGAAIAIAVHLLLDLARELVFDDVPRRARRATFFNPLRDIGRLRFVNQFLVYLAVLTAGLAREYFLRDRTRQQEAIVLQAQLAEARLDALRMQINPHFLFNTLHAISALVERDPGGVRRMIARLSELLRHTIDSRGTDEIPLEEELAFLRRYIEIMEIRFQGKLQVTTSIEEATRGALVPNLILQPLVENALEHGVSRVTGEGEITIDARRDANRLVLSVRDNGPGVRGGDEGVGLPNTRARLAQLYGGEATLTLLTAPEGGAIAQITMPFRSAP
ncbi:MAG TPA: sensor histidine kinase [Thermoanaerobaculia bacterium]|jgi:signal transduction histidine kinase